MKPRKYYFYDGPVWQFGIQVKRNFKCGTLALSEKQALAQINYKAKHDLCLGSTAKLELKMEYLHWTGKEQQK